MSLHRVKYDIQVQENFQKRCADEFFATGDTHFLEMMTASHYVLITLYQRKYQLESDQINNSTKSA